MYKKILVLLIIVIVTGCQKEKKTIVSDKDSATHLPAFSTIKGFTLGDPLTVCPKGSFPHPSNKGDIIFGCYIEPTTFLGQVAYFRLHAGDDKKINQMAIYIEEKGSIYPFKKLFSELLLAYGKPISTVFHDNLQVVTWIDSKRGIKTVASEVMFLGKKQLNVAAIRAETKDEKREIRLLADPKSDL